MLNPNPALHATKRGSMRGWSTGTPKPHTPAAWSSTCPKPHSSADFSQEQADLAELTGCTPKPTYKKSTWQAEGMLFSVHKQENATGT